MDFASLNESYSEGAVLAAGGLGVGVLFGFFAQRSRFCLRAAVIEFGTPSLARSSPSGC